MDTMRITEILTDCLGHTDENGAASAGTEVVDAWQMVPLRTDKVHEHERELVELLRDWPSEAWGEPVPPLGQEISYITAGAVLDDQGRAFVLFAVGKLLGWWQVLDPHSVMGLDRDSELAKQMAGMGYVSIAGYTPANVPAP